MITGLVLFALDRWLKGSVPSQLTDAVLMYPWVTAGILLGLIVIWAGVYQKKLPLWAAGWVTFGVLSNALDAVSGSGVIDYLPVFGYRTNIADLMIISGCIYCGWAILRSARPAQSP